MVGGEIVVRQNVPTGAMPGKVLRRQDCTAAGMTQPLRTVVIGLDHYHVTGWVETLGLFPEQIEIVGRYRSRS